MLILTRRPPEVIMVGDNITIQILDVTGCQVRIGVNAPKSIPVHREEIYLRIQQERKAKEARKTTSESGHEIDPCVD